VRRAILFIFIILGAAQGCLASDHSLSFQLHRDYLILVKCSVANYPGLTAVIDTGTTETILDLSLVRRLSLPNWPDSATSLNQDSAARGVSIPDLQLGPLQVNKLDGVAMDLSSVGRQLGVRPDVVIGMDVLHRANFTIDYRARIITFDASPPLAHRAPLAPALRFVLIDSNVLGRPMRLQVDTGFNGLLLFGKQPGDNSHSADTGARIAGVTQASSVQSVDSPEFQVGNWRTYHIVVSVLDGPPRNSTEFDGLLGPRLLGARRVSFDFDHRMLYWD
jgi:predicted aspartyl protease